MCLKWLVWHLGVVITTSTSEGLLAMALDIPIKREVIMGEYECWDCDEMFWVDEPPEDREVCDECRKEYKNDG